MQNQTRAHHALHISVLFLLLISSSCNTAPSAGPTTAPSNTATWTPNLPQTFTPTATFTASPTFTLIPTTTPLVEGLGQVVFSENFDDLNFPFNIYGPDRIDGGVLVMEREAGYKPPPDMWPTNGIYGITPVSPGTTTIILFKAAGGINFNIGYHTGAYGTESLRRFNFNSGGRWDLYEGKSTTTIKSWNARQLQPDTWHYFSITRSANGDIDAQIWEQDKPETKIRFQGNLGPEWGKLELTFVADFRWGSFMLDEYQDLK